MQHHQLWETTRFVCRDTRRPLKCEWGKSNMQTNKHEELPAKEMLVLYLILNSIFNWTRLICLRHAQSSLRVWVGMRHTHLKTLQLLMCVLSFQFRNSINIKIINIKQFIILDVSSLNSFINITSSCFKLCLLTAIFFDGRTGVTSGETEFFLWFLRCSIWGCLCPWAHLTSR